MEEEVRKVVSGARLSADLGRLDAQPAHMQPLRQNQAAKSYDLPRQLPQELEKLEQKRQELIKWEDGLLQKSR